MLYWIAKKYDGWSGVRAKDVEVELWIKALKILQDTEDYNLNLIATSCYRRGIDICRKAKREKLCIPFTHVRDQSNLRNVVDDSHDLDEDDNNFSKETYEILNNQILSSESQVLSENNSDYGSSLVLTDMMELFVPYSKEYMFIRLCALYFDIDLIENRRDGWRFEDFFSRDRFEFAIARALGFSDDTSTGYRNMRMRIKQTLEEHGFHDLLLSVKEKQ